MPEEIFSSDALHAIHARGDPKHGTLIRFSGALIGRDETPRWAGNLIRQWPGDTRWAGNLIRQWPGDTILITPRDKGYFAARDMQPLLERLPDLPRPVICSGSSMGAYAALKYSRILGAEAVLAFAPQFSVSPHEAPFDPERHAFHDPGRHGDMAIRAEDVSGNVAIFFDPHVQTDRDHAQATHRSIQAAVSVAMVPVTYSTHVVVTLMDSGPKLRTTIHLTRRMDAPGLHRFYRQLKRQTPRYRIELAVAAAYRWRFDWAEAVIQDAAARFGWTRSVHLAHARVLQAKGDIQAAHQAAEAGIRAHDHRPEAAQSILAGAIARTAGNRDAALVHYRAAMEADPFRPGHHTAYAETLIHYGLDAEAAEVLRNARARFPSDRRTGWLLWKLTGEPGPGYRPSLTHRAKRRIRNLLKTNRVLIRLRREVIARWPNLARRIRRLF